MAEQKILRLVEAFANEQPHLASKQTAMVEPFTNRLRWVLVRQSVSQKWLQIGRSCRPLPLWPMWRSQQS
jgi:hypothetical protein